LFNREFLNILNNFQIWINDNKFYNNSALFGYGGAINIKIHNQNIFTNYPFDQIYIIDNKFQDNIAKVGGSLYYNGINQN
jgi:hypothetical protein